MTITRIELAPAAKEDLADIARYTMQKWGKPQALKYAGFLDSCFQKIVEGKDRSKAVLPGRKDVRFCRCQQHYVFYLRRKDKTVIIAVLHERMDLMIRLKDRLPE